MSNKPSGRYGFRFSVIDAIVLALGAAATWALWQQDLPIWWLVPCVVGHFFLFCNVFRVRRNYELIWAALFLLNTGYWLNHDAMGWNPALLWQLPVTMVAIIAELRSPNYHGIGARRINRNLDAYLNR